MTKHILLVLLCCSSVFAQTDKFQPAAGERAIGRYVVSIEDDAGTVDVARRARELAAIYGGRLEPYAGEGATFAVSMLPVRARALSADPRVRSVVEVLPGDATPSVSAPAQKTPVPPSQPRHLKSNSYDATWNSGVYAYDGAGNIVSIGANTYLYDGASRLVKGTARTVGYGNMQCFSYDAFGNMRQVVTSLQVVPTCADITATTGMTVVAGVNPNSNRIDVAVPAGTPANARVEYGTFDDAGNQLSSDGVTQYSYDSMHRIEELTTPAHLRDETYLYDGSDDRISTLTFSAGQLVGISRALRDADGKVLRDVFQVRNGSNWTWQWAKDYVYRDSSLLAAVAAGPNNTTSTTHFHLDHLGSPRLITTDTGMRLAQHTYMPFGEEAPGSDRDTERMKFAGAERDADGSGDSSLDYMHARYYAPDVGRFLSVDRHPGEPKRPQSWNRYVYASNNPIVRIDLDGNADFYVTTTFSNSDFHDDRVTDYLSYNAANFDISNGTATPENFQKGLSDPDGVSIYFGHSNTTDSLLFNKAGFVPFSTFSNRNAVTCISACNSSAIIKDAKVGPGHALIGVTSNLKAGYVKAGDLSYISTQLIAGLKAGKTVGQIIDGLNKYYADRGKKDRKYRVQLTIKGDRNIVVK